MIETFRCPNCGAPLQIAQPGQHTIICHYCNSSVRVTPSADGAAPTIEASDIAPEIIERIKQLVAEGHQAEAIRAYQEASGTSEEEASATIAALGRELAMGIILGQRLRPLGILMSMAL